jgi:hypothetical protein
MLYRADDHDLFVGFKVEGKSRSIIEISNFIFVDETILFCEANA